MSDRRWHLMWVGIFGMNTAFCLWAEIRAAQAGQEVLMWMWGGLYTIAAGFLVVAANGASEP